MTTPDDVLVTTDWLADNLDAPGVVVADVDEDLDAYARGHIPGAVGFHWEEDFRDPVERDIVDRDGFARLVSEKGIGDEDLVVLYGGNDNWFAAYAYWVFRLYGHDRVTLLDGGRRKWELEDRPFTQEVPDPEPATYEASDPDRSIRALRDDILAEFVGAPEGRALVDVRSPEEFSGELVAPPHLPQESAQVAGHIPGAVNISWSQAVDDDTGEFLPVGDLRKLYESEGVTPDREVATYCRIGERSAHSWFVLHELLGYDDVRNYDGSWTEYGSLVGVPVER